jgi:hypothetical protein
LTLHSKGSLATIRTEGGGGTFGEREIPVRGQIKEWSRKSRMALKCALAELDRDALAKSIFITLTYPGEFPAPDDHGVYKQHLRVFLQSLIREYGKGVAGVWKLEFQQRDAAHYHLLITGFAGDLLALREWVARRWYEVVGSNDPKHLRAGTGVEPAQSIQGALTYLAKYMSKEDQTRPGNFTGRYWGKFNREALPVSPVEVIDLEGSKECAAVNRWMRKIIKGHVMDTRWRIALEKSKGWMDPGNGWTRTGAERALTGAKVMNITRRERKDLGIPKGAEVWTEITGPGLFKLPKKFKLRAGSTLRLIVDAGKFGADILRARALGLFAERDNKFKRHE